MLGEGNEPPYLRRYAAQEPSPRTLHFVPLGGPTSVSQPPQNPTLASLVEGTDFRRRNPRKTRHSLRSLRGPTSVVATPQNPILASLVEGTDLRSGNAQNGSPFCNALDEFAFVDLID